MKAICAIPTAPSPSLIPLPPTDIPSTQQMAAGAAQTAPSQIHPPEAFRPCAGTHPPPSPALRGPRAATMFCWHFFPPSMGIFKALFLSPLPRAPLL